MKLFYCQYWCGQCERANSEHVCSQFGGPCVTGRTIKEEGLVYFFVTVDTLRLVFSNQFLVTKRWWNKKYRSHIIFCTGSWFRKPGPGFGRTKIVIFLISLESIKKTTFLRFFIRGEKMCLRTTRWYLFSLIGTHWLVISIP